MNRDEQRIEQQIRAWARRPPIRSPRVARAEVLTRLRQRRAWPEAYRQVFAVAIGAGMVVALLLLQGTSPPAPSAPVVAERRESGPTPGLLVHELRSGTPLYMSLPTSPSGPHGAATGAALNPPN
ncbi:MAG: hypothetical protein AAF657_32575 [Acidobacteriota bacterium]